MDPREKAGIKEHRRLLLEEIRGHRYAIRNDVLISNGRVVHARHKAVTFIRTLRFAPTAASFIAGLIRGRKDPGPGRKSGGGIVKSFASAFLGGYALFHLLK